MNLIEALQYEANKVVFEPSRLCTVSALLLMAAAKELKKADVGKVECEIVSRHGGRYQLAEPVVEVATKDSPDNADLMYGVPPEPPKAKRKKP